MTIEDHPELEQTHALADGELSGAALERAQDHLATCERCQGELSDIMQLEAMPMRSLAAGITPISWYRKRPVQVASVLVAAAAATVLILGSRKHKPITPEPPTRIALASKRSMEARLSWQGAADYREYSVQRGSTVAKEPISLSALADLEKSGDLHGVGALALLGGDLEQAKKYLALAGDSPDVLADHAALELQLGDPEGALVLADTALAKSPDLTAAIWNRGLALRELGLGHTAAEAFRIVAKRAEPGWAKEATQRADELERGFSDAIATETRIIQAAKPLAQTGSGLSVDDARRIPGTARVELYDAMFAAPDAERIARLKPLAEAVGANDVLDHAKPDPAVAKAYLSLLVDDKPNREAILSTLRAAHANDALVVAFVKLGDDDGIVQDKDVDELSKLAAASHDTWIQMLGLEQRAARALRAHDLASAEPPLLAGRAMCQAGAPSHRCMKIEMLLGRTYLEWQRLPEARTALQDAFKRSGELSASWERGQILMYLTDLDGLTDDTVGGGLPLVRAYAAEVAARAVVDSDDPCDWTLWAHERVANLLITQLRFDEAARELAAVTCKVGKRKATEQAAGLFIRSEILHVQGTPDQIATLRTEITAARGASEMTVGEKALLDLAEGRAIIAADPKQGETLLREAIAKAQRDPNSDNAHRAFGAAFATLATTAIKHGDGDAALAVLGEELGVTPRKTCVLGLAVDDRDVAIVARGSDGKTLAETYERTTTDLVASKVVPGRVSGVFKDCADVDVIARPPYHGLAQILPDAIAWRYLTRRTRPTGESRGESVVVADVQPPASLGLPHLAAWSHTGTMLTGPAATPTRVLAAIGNARDVTIHAHGLADHGDASYLALSPDPDGNYALTARVVEHAHFAGNPLVILAACEAALAAPVLHERWSLPSAFVTAGAKAVIAPTVAVPDADAAAFFDELRKQAASGESVAVTLRNLRAKWPTPDAIWVHGVVVFE